MVRPVSPKPTELRGSAVIDCSRRSDRDDGVGEVKAIEFVGSEPVHFVMLVGSGIGDLTFPARDRPYLDVEIRLGRTLQDANGTRGVYLNAKLLSQFANECIDRRLALIDVSTWHVPDIRIPPTIRVPVTKQHPTVPYQHSCDNIMVLDVLRFHIDTFAQPWLEHRRFHGVAR